MPGFVLPGHLTGQMISEIDFDERVACMFDPLEGDLGSLVRDAGGGSVHENQRSPLNIFPSNEVRGVDGGDRVLGGRSNLERVCDDLVRAPQDVTLGHQRQLCSLIQSQFGEQGSIGRQRGARGEVMDCAFEAA